MEKWIIHSFIHSIRHLETTKLKEQLPQETNVMEAAGVDKKQQQVSVDWRQDGLE